MNQFNESICFYEKESDFHFMYPRKLNPDLLRVVCSHFCVWDPKISFHIDIASTMFLKEEFSLYFSICLFEMYNFSKVVVGLSAVKSQLWNMKEIHFVYGFRLVRDIYYVVILTSRIFSIQQYRFRASFWKLFVTNTDF